MRFMGTEPTLRPNERQFTVQTKCIQNVWDARAWDRLATDNLSGAGTLCHQGSGALRTSVLCSRSPLFRDGEMKNRPLIGRGLHPNEAAALVHDSLANGEADAGAWNFAAMQPLEETEDLLAV